MSRTDTTVNIEREPTDRQLGELAKYYDQDKKTIVSHLVETAHARMLEQEMTRGELKEHIMRERFGLDDDLVATLVDETSAENA